MKVNDLLEAKNLKSLSPEALDLFLDLVHETVADERINIREIMKIEPLIFFEPAENFVFDKKMSREDYDILDSMSAKDIEAAFVDKFKKSSDDYIKELSQKDINKVPANVKKVLNFLNKEYHAKITPRDMENRNNEYFYAYYQKSPTKMVISQEKGGIKLVWTDENLQKVGFKKEDIVKFFDYFKKKISKRPKNKKVADTYYD